MSRRLMGYRVSIARAGHSSWWSGAALQSGHTNPVTLSDHVLCRQPQPCCPCIEPLLLGMVSGNGGTAQYIFSSNSAPLLITKQLRFRDGEREAIV